ncbi:MAG: 16S rRNA (uracil1498-N3)-methyltransferase [Lentimonas sp.]|jgi:16S rRNA (uracil1498-N3)-methyltransferase
MNLMLFDDVFESVRLESADPRAQHLRKVLRAEVGTLVFLGFVNGPRARAKVVAVEPGGGFELEVVGTETAPAPLPIHLLIGLPRPHTAKRILFEAASLGVTAIHFFEAERSEPSYAQSSLWQTDEWRDRIRLGTEQAFGTYLPQVAMHADLQSAISVLHGADVHVALDNYEAGGSLGQVLPSIGASAVIALGPERGWTADERDVFRKNGWRLAHMGAHVLRAETACVAAVSATASQLGLWTEQTATEL